MTIKAVKNAKLSIYLKGIDSSSVRCYNIFDSENKIRTAVRKRRADEITLSEHHPGGRLRIHAYSPQEKMGPRQKRFVYTYAYCVCMFGTPSQRVWPAKYFDLAKSYGVEPWSYFPVEDPALIDAALAAGTRLFTINDPAWLMAYLRQKGLHQ